MKIIKEVKEDLSIQSFEDYCKIRLKKDGYIGTDHLQDCINVYELLYNEYINNINETLTKSYSLKLLCNKLQSKFKIYKAQTNTANSILNLVLDKDFDDKDKSFLSLLNFYNCNISTNTVEGKYKYISIESTYGNDVTAKIKSKYKYLYHFTRTRKIDKILKYGLSPKTQSKISYHPERIYLFDDSLGSKNKDILMKELEIADSNKTHIFDTSSLIKINISKLEENVKFFEDPKAMNGCLYTLNFIPPSAISLVKDTNFLNKIKNFINKYLKL